jgi:hypothetical protein
MNSAAGLQANMADLNGSPSILSYELLPTDFDVPSGLRLPPQLHQSISSLENEAMATIRAMKMLMERRDNHFIALCPFESDHFKQHVLSMRLLLAWKSEWNPIDNTVGPSLSVSAKIPGEVLKILANQQAYNNVAHQHAQMVDNFLRGQFQAWIQARSDIDHLARHLMCNPRSLRYNNVQNHEAFSVWYHGRFADAMFEWESCLGQLTLPSFEETIQELRELLHDRVDTEQGLTQRV